MSQTTLTSTFSEDVDQNGVEYPNDGGDGCGVQASADGRHFRVAIRFDPSSIPAGDAVSLVELIIDVIGVQNVSTHSWYIGGYKGTGQGDPEADSAAAAYSGCFLLGDNYGSFTDLRTTGIKTITLGAGAISDLEAAIDAASVYTVAMRLTDESVDSSVHRSDMTEYTDGTNPPKLRVTHSAAAASGDVGIMGLARAARFSALLRR